MKRTILIAFTVLWMAFIFLFSSGNGEVSRHESSRVTTAVQKIFFKNWEELPEETFRELFSNLNYLIRKIAHFTEYLILGGLLAGIMQTFSLRSLQRFAAAFPAGVLYALTDEWHQSFVPGRTMAFFDVLVDSAGVFFGVVTVLFAVIALTAEKENRQKEGEKHGSKL